MLTYDLSLNKEDGWVAIAPIGTTTNIINSSGFPIQCRFGIASSSGGFLLNLGDTLDCSTTVYVRFGGAYGVTIVVTGS